MLNDCKRCSEIKAVFDKYDFSEYYQPLANNSKEYTCDRKNPDVIQPEIVLSLQLSFPFIKYSNCQHFDIFVIKT